MSLSGRSSPRATLPNTPMTRIRNSAAYIAGWAAKPQADAKLVVYAAAHGQRAADRVQRLDFDAGGSIDPAENAAA